MKPVFADTVYLAALISSRDQYHQQACELADLIGDLVATEFVLLEVADGIASSSNRNEFVRARERLTANGGVTIVPASAELFEEGVRLYASRTDKFWSLTDCTSFVVMTRMGLM